MKRTKPVRTKDGKFKRWPGGKTARKDDRTWHGSMARVGREFKRQNGRIAKVGDIVRDKNKSGSYNRGSPWFVKTPYGWRKVKYSRRRKKT